MPSFQPPVQARVRGRVSRTLEVEDLPIGADGTPRGRACVGISLEAVPDAGRKAALGRTGLSIIGSTDWRLGHWRRARGIVGAFFSERSRGHVVVRPWRFRCEEVSKIGGGSTGGLGGFGEVCVWMLVAVRWLTIIERKRGEDDMAVDVYV